MDILFGEEIPGDVPGVEFARQDQSRFDFTLSFFTSLAVGYQQVILTVKSDDLL